MNVDFPQWSTSPLLVMSSTDAHKASSQCFSASVLNMNRQPGIIRELRKVSNLTELQTLKVEERGNVEESEAMQREENNTS